MKRSRLKPKRAIERRSSRVRDEAYLAWIRMQPCAISRIVEHIAAVGTIATSSRAALVCHGPIDPEHRREGVGMGQKASDRDAWPCCRKHHGDRHDGTGLFKGWTRTQMNEFIRTQIADANARYDRELESKVPQ